VKDYSIAGFDQFLSLSSLVKADEILEISDWKSVNVSYVEVLTVREILVL
jgi:hypothetical protein